MKNIHPAHPATTALIAMDEKLQKMTDEQLKTEVVVQSSWQFSRLDFIKTLYPDSFFKGKSLLELGSCDGFFGNIFSQMGADVTCVEGKEIYSRIIKIRHPHLKLITKDCDTIDWTFGKFDIIINFGILYHLENHHEEFLTNCIQNCNCMLLESVIYDSPNSEIYYRKEAGCGQGLSGVGGTPTTSFVEDIFKKHNVTFQKYCDSRLNAIPHCYDWTDGNRGYDCFRRRFWTVTKTN